MKSKQKVNALVALLGYWQAAYLLQVQEWIQQCWVSPGPYQEVFQWGGGRVMEPQMQHLLRGRQVEKVIDGHRVGFAPAQKCDTPGICPLSIRELWCSSGETDSPSCLQTSRVLQSGGGQWHILPFGVWFSLQSETGLHPSKFWPLIGVFYVLWKGFLPEEANSFFPGSSWASKPNSSENLLWKP